MRVRDLQLDNARDVAVTYMVPRAWADSPGRVLQLLRIINDLLRTLKPVVL